MENKNGANKIDAKGRRLIRQWIIGGDSNNAILRKLTEAGYPEISRPALSQYRGAPDVQEALAVERAELRQIGFANLERQVETLDIIAERLAKQLGVYYADTFDPDTPPPCGWDKFNRLVDKLFDVLDKIRALVDDPEPAGQSAQAGQYQPMPAFAGFSLGAFNDGYERMLSFVEQRRAAKQLEEG